MGEILQGWGNLMGGTFLDVNFPGGIPETIVIVRKEAKKVKTEIFYLRYGL